MPSAVVGWVGAIVASIFFGSNYVPTKNYPTGDGMAFVWVFASGVMSVGIVTIFMQQSVNPANHEIVFVYSGLLGGSLWAAGNLCVIPIVKMIGLGLGMIVWGSTSLITGFFCGKFGLFGLDKHLLASSTADALNWCGLLAIVFALGFFFFVKPTLTNEGYETIEEAVKINADPKPSELSIFDRVPMRLRLPVGFGLGIVSGLLYGVNMVPLQLWAQDLVNPWPLDFVFSHFLGIYIFSTVVFLVYCIAVRPPQVFGQTMLPAFISGTMWGIAQCGLMMATAILGYTVGFPVGSTGPLVVSALWSVLYFREIRGQRNFLFLGFSFMLLGVGIVLITLSSLPNI